MDWSRCCVDRWLHSARRHRSHSTRQEETVNKGQRATANRGVVGEMCARTPTEDERGRHDAFHDMRFCLPFACARAGVQAHESVTLKRHECKAELQHLHIRSLAFAPLQISAHIPTQHSTPCWAILPRAGQVQEEGSTCTRQPLLLCAVSPVHGTGHV